MQKMTAFKSVADVTAFAVAQGEELQSSDQDYRTLGHTKRLHIIAKSLGYDNWQQYSAILTKQEFINTMMYEFGLGEQYADAAWFTLSDRTKPGADMARHYCARYNIVAKPKEQPLAKDYERICKWLFDNSSGTYRPAAEAAELIKDFLSTLNNDRRTVANKEFEDFEFDSDVEDTSGWSIEGDMWEMTVFMENGDKPSITKTFFVKFFPRSSLFDSHGVS
jgi:hypothetical protein